MNTLAKKSVGDTYIIKWLLGLPYNVAEYLQLMDITPGKSIRVIQSCEDYVIVRSGSHCIAMEAELAAKIRV